MQLMKQFSANEAKYSFVLETKALGETEPLTVLGKWCHTELRAGYGKGNARLALAQQRWRLKTNRSIIIAP